MYLLLNSVFYYELQKLSLNMIQANCPIMVYTKVLLNFSFLEMAVTPCNKATHNCHFRG